MAQKHKTITTTTKKKLNWMFPQLVEEFKYYMYGAYKETLVFGNCQYTYLNYI